MSKGDSKAAKNQLTPLELKVQNKNAEKWR